MKRGVVFVIIAIVLVIGLVWWSRRKAAPSSYNQQDYTETVQSDTTVRRL